MIYIDFDGVILDTEELMFKEWRKNPNRHLLKPEDKVKYLQNIDWDYVLNNSKPIKGSIDFLNNIDPKNTTILTKVHSLKEGSLKVEWIRKQGIKQSVVIVPYTLKKSDVTNPIGNTLIDDCLKNLDEWENSGGNAIFFDMDNDNYDSWHDYNKKYKVINDLNKYNDKVE